jgi:hypothetical protein
MSRTHKDSKHLSTRERHLSVRAIRRDPPDLRKLSRALIQLAMAEAAAEAEAETQAKADGHEPSVGDPKPTPGEVPE